MGRSLRDGLSERSDEYTLLGCLHSPPPHQTEHQGERLWPRVGAGVSEGSIMSRLEVDGLTLWD